MTGLLSDRPLDFFEGRLRDFLAGMLRLLAMILKMTHTSV